MGTIITVDTNNESNFSGKKLVDPGIYKCAIQPKPLTVSKGKNPPYNNIIKLELKVLFAGDGSETPFRGQTIFDNLVLIKNSEWKLTHFALASGAYSKDDLKNNGGQIDIDRLTEMEEVTVKVGVESSTPEGSTTPKLKNVVEAYVFEGM